MTNKGDEAAKDRYVRESDAIQRFFGRPFFLSLTIGIPFCAYKLLFGVTAVRVASLFPAELLAFGWVVIAWAGIDLLMNAGRAIFDVFGKPVTFEYCIIAQIGKYFRMPMVFLALDTLLSFLIIVMMLWSGWITLLTQPELYLWYGATTLNLISLSVVSLYNEIRRA